MNSDNRLDLTLQSVSLAVMSGEARRRLPSTARAPRLRAWGILAACLAAGRLAGQEQIFSAHNCAITPPRGWHALTNTSSHPGQLFSSGDAARTRFVLLIVDDRQKAAVRLDEQFIAEFDRGVEKSSRSRRLSGRITEIAGVPCYERVGTLDLGGRDMSTLIQAMSTSQGFYILQAMRADGRAGEDPEIRQCLASFRFLTPPKTMPFSRKSSAYRLGYVLGAGTVVVAVGAILIGAIVVVTKVARHRRHRSIVPMPPRIPPFPPGPGVS